MKHFDVVVVGAGHGGAQACISLRQQGFEGSIAIVGDEPELPYERPPLSKEYLSGEKPFERLLIRPAGFWAEREIAMCLGERVLALDPVSKTLKVGTDSVRYGKLVWAAGGSARRLTCSGNDLPGVHSVRSRQDVDRVMAELPRVQHAVVIGGGYIGLEAAAVLRKLGKSVVLLEAADRILNRVAGKPLSRFFEDEHRRQGVDLRLGVQVDCIIGTDRVTGVKMHDGSVIPCDLVVVGVGIEPNVSVLADGGAIISNGVEIDEQCRTSLTDVFAIGDCARQSNPYADGEPVRIESVQNATDQAKAVAAVILGNGPAAPVVPWFWSNQYDLKLQTVGLSAGHELSIVRGDPATRSFSVVYMKDGCVVALDAVNAVRDYVQAKSLIESRARIAAVSLADATTPLKTLVA